MRIRADHQECKLKTEIEGKRKSAASFLQYFAFMLSANKTNPNAQLVYQNSGFKPQTHSFKLGVNYILTIIKKKP